MDIAALSMGISQADVMNNVETAVLAKSLDTMKETGAGLIDMMDRSVMERSVNPDITSMTARCISLVEIRAALSVRSEEHTSELQSPS